MSLEHTRKVYEKLGRKNPFYAVLTTKRFRDGTGDAEDFFRTGRQEIRAVLEYVESLGWTFERNRALDFGCGAGRLTQALADHFDEVVGVDIARTMVEAAREHNRHGDRVRYVVNTSDDLTSLGPLRFDFVYSSLTLQHVPPEHSANYIREFVRLLRPGGLTVFQLAGGPRIEAGTLRAWLYRLKRHHLRRFWKRIRGLPAYEMHYLARSRVEEAIRAAAGRIVDVKRLGKGDPGTGLRYSATR